MPSPTVALELIKSSMRLIGVLASGENPTPDEANDAMRTLQDLIENWSIEKLSVWGISNQTFALVPGQSTYTIGPAGLFNTVRPVSISSGYTAFGGQDFPISFISQEEYNLIDVKTLPQPVIERAVFINDYPLAKLVVWPTPTAALPITLSIARSLTAPINLTDSIVGPPGYLKALKFCLAVEIAAEYGVVPPAIVVQIAADSKGDYKKANMTPVVSRFDEGMTERTSEVWGY